MSRPDSIDPATLALFQLLPPEEQRAIVRLIGTPEKGSAVPARDRKAAKARAKQLKPSRKDRKKT